MLIIQVRSRFIMSINNKGFAAVWRAAILAFGLWGLLDGSGILKGQYTENFPHMFTNISNMFVWVYFLLALVCTAAKKGEDGAVFAPFFKYTATVSLMVTMLIGHFMLFDALVQDGHIVWHLIVLHYVVPIMTLLDWLLFDKKGKMPVWGPLTWISLALFYLAFSIIGVGVFGLYMGGGTTADISPYPYTFLDPAIAGAGGVAGFCAAMLAAFILLGYVLFWVDRALGKRHK